MNNEKQIATLKDTSKLLAKNNRLPDETSLNNNIISYFIINDKQGAIVLARQFHAITKSELFYHAAFCHQFLKNCGKEKNETKSFFDNRELRYVYLTLENSSKNNDSDSESERLYSVLIIKVEYNIFSAFNVIKMIQRMICEIIKNKPKEHLQLSTSNLLDNNSNKGKVSLKFLFFFQLIFYLFKFILFINLFMCLLFVYLFILFILVLISINE